MIMVEERVLLFFVVPLTLLNEHNLCWYGHMHPPLFRPHPDCQDIIRRLVECHEANKFMKFFGSCNEVKSELDECFAREKEAKKRENLKKAREFDAKFAKVLAATKAKEGEKQEEK